MLKGILNFAHYLLEESVNPGDTTIDATCGNGNDTLFLSRIVGTNGHVIACDIQQQAIDATRQRLVEHNRFNVSFIQDSHARLKKYINKDTQIGGAIFNLGYLPKSDKLIITNGESTISAIESILDFLKQGRLIVLVVYHGHPGGEEEKNIVLKHVMNLDQNDYNVVQYGFINQKNNPPFIIAIEKKQ
ncbi:class I SAM-dependent methyltransferase [Virgibacillus halodenitrificans]|nr:class I SAM-dependent methyltransferase [Virgibacillus halodenitrificans]MCG1030213.1 class I SAM-dependent methyltransferase [Virgibacillus halodenitrificans]MEC2161091.1 class I SAM-dependent methyltransferase [Virgibacillus halodenitrificans]CDQ30655.1 arsenite S-adenosylmethyltransferase [Virgibacillus halodenitrificans]